MFTDILNLNKKEVCLFSQVSAGVLSGLRWVGCYPVPPDLFFQSVLEPVLLWKIGFMGVLTFYVEQRMENNF